LKAKNENGKGALGGRLFCVSGRGFLENVGEPHAEAAFA
jgi:hypothetical protein